MKIGIYQHYWRGVGGGQRYLAVTAEALAREHDVELVHHIADFDPRQVEEPLEVDLARVKFRYLPASQRPLLPSKNPWKRFRWERDLDREISAPYDLFINSSEAIPCFCHARHGVLIAHFPLVTFEEFNSRGSKKWAKRNRAVQWALHTYQRFEWKRRFGSYDLAITNSNYSRGWLRRRWGIDAAVAYPPRRDGFLPAAKEPLIVSIGAFHQSRHKRHDVLIKNFRELCEQGLTGWRLILIGARGQDREDHAYVDWLALQAAGAPVEIWTDASSADLKSVLERASLLWHAMGYGVDPERDPGLLEHFGMVMPEAMAAGCVPIAFRGGGILESVEHGESGFLWSTDDELKRYTMTAIQDDSRRARMADRAIWRAERFSRSSFERRMLDMLAPLLYDESGAG